MEATRRDGGGPAARPPPPPPSSSSSSRKRHEQIGSAAGSYTRSSRSGTIVSTAYTSGASRPSPSTDFELKINDGYDEHHLSRSERNKEQEKMKRVLELVNGGVKRWFTELGVAWILDLPDAEFAREIERNGRSWGVIAFYAPSWIHALAEIVETIRFTSTLPLITGPCSHTDTDTGGGGGGGDEEQAAAVPNNHFFLRRVTSKILQRVKSKLLFLTNDDLVTTTEGQNQIISSSEKSTRITDQKIQFARFTQAAMSKMLAFVDVLVAVDLSQLYSSLYTGDRELYTYHKSLSLLLRVHGVLSKASYVINVLFISSLPGEVQRILGEIFRLLSTKEEKAFDAAWLTLNDTTTHVLKRIQDLSLQQGSSDIHKATLSVVSHISFLMENRLPLDLILSEADNRGKVYAHESRIGNQTHSDSMIIRIMASRLQEELASRSESFLSDQGLRFLFLLNNSHRLYQCLVSEPGWSCLKLYVESLSTKVDGYMQSYLQVSWAPVLSCLSNPTPCFLAKKEKYSPLTRFESEFQKTCITQKQWKVPDPELRKNLRTAIVEQIIPGYTKYTGENNITTPTLAPQELEEMLQDLFEG